MAETARPQTSTSLMRDLTRRLNEVERATSRVSAASNSQSANAAALAENAAELAANSELLAQNAEELAQNAEVIAEAAQTTADGKNAVYRQPSAPTGGTYAVNDLWIDTDDGYRVWTWNGTAWTQNLFGSAAISDVSATAIAGQLTSNQIAQLNADKIAGQLTSGQIASVNATVIAGQIGAGQIAAGAITTAKLAAGAVTASTIDAGAITTDKIFAGAITTEKINALAITSEKINAGAIIAEKINAGAITSEKINAGAITTAKLAAGAVTATEIAANAITADKIDANAMTAKNYFSKATGQNRIIMGPSVEQAGWSAITFDLSGDGVNDLDPSISAPNGRMLLRGYTAGSSFSRITIGDAMSVGSPFDVVLQSSDGGITSNLVISAANNHVRVSRDFKVDGSLVTMTGVFNNTTNSAANVHMSPSAVLRYVNTTSMMSVKDDVSDMSDAELDPKRLLKARIVQYRYKHGQVAPTDQRYRKLLPGFIAEDMADKYPIAVDLDEAGNPYGINDRFLMPAMLALIQDAHRRLTVLEALPGVRGQL